MFESLTQLPPDPILGLLSRFREDPRDHKIDLGIGVYLDEQGHTPIMGAVKEAERRLLETEQTKTYQNIAGDPLFGQLLSDMALGQSKTAVQDRLSVIQTPGGCGALCAGASVLQRARPGATVWVSTPTWVNHIPLIGGTGLRLKEYPYYQPTTGGIDFDAMMSCLKHAESGDILLLHASCHNPTGADLSVDQWDVVVEEVLARGLVPFVDLAYQGLGDGMEQDSYGLRKLASAVPEMVMAVSCSKNFGIYRERTGATMLLSETASKADAVMSHGMAAARQMWSMPPSHGAAIVTTVLSDADLKGAWAGELESSRQRILVMRERFEAGLRANGANGDFSFITRQKGMFSYLGISQEQINRLRDEYAVYIVDSTRVNIAGMTPANVDYLAEAVSAVL